MTGLRPTLVDARDKIWGFHRLFGVAYNFPSEYDADNGKTMPDQSRDRRPTACTSYTIAEIGYDQDGFPYSSDYQFMKTLQAMNVPPDTQGADLRTAFKVATVFGLLPKEFEPSNIYLSNQTDAADQSNWPAALDHESIHKPAYIPITPVPDWFDGIRSALMLGSSEHRTVGVGTPWYGQFNDVGKNGILPDNPSGSYSWHAYKISGWKLIDGVPYLRAKPWGGKHYGDNGWVYISRELINKLMGTWGSYAATLQDLPTNSIEELKSLRVSMLEVAIALMKNLVIRLRYALAH